MTWSCLVQGTCQIPVSPPGSAHSSPSPSPAVLPPSGSVALCLTYCNMPSPLCHLGTGSERLWCDCLEALNTYCIFVLASRKGRPHLGMECSPGVVSQLWAVKDAGAGAHREAELGRHLLSVRRGDGRCQVLAPEHAWRVSERSWVWFHSGQAVTGVGSFGSFVWNHIKAADGVVTAKGWQQFQNLWPKPCRAPPYKIFMLIIPRVFENLTLSLLVTSRSCGPFPIDQDPFLTSNTLGGRKMPICYSTLLQLNDTRTKQSNNQPI